ncbi:interleukin-6 receptor subunit beta isoform X2 [Eleginops maclovinus]|uniref:interleukin-6 receptor subunit beta isoform X2 n=1 Tax=Eleginops maclovinus TaxID=56733 RepID=UPI0030806956
MDILSHKLYLATMTAMSLLRVFSHETLNMSCYYQISHRSMTCEWSQDSDSHIESDVSLIFSSVNEIISCKGIFFRAAVLNVTARIKNYVMKEIWSKPHTVFLYNAIKPSTPVLTVLGSTEDSVVVSWRSSSDGSCRLRYRMNNTPIWTLAHDSVPSHQDQTLNYTMKDLLTFTIYQAGVACREEPGFFSDWSSDVSARTLDRVPSRPPKVCYRVEKRDSDGSLLLHLMWKHLDLPDAGVRILGYQVSYTPVKNQPVQDSFIQNFTGSMVLLVVKEGNRSVTVSAFNTAGYGPAAHLSIDTQRQSALPPVRNLWVSSSSLALKGLFVQWENPTVLPSDPPVSHLAIHWRSKDRPSTSRGTTVDSFTTSTVIQDVDPEESYLITVFPVYNQQCGSPQSLPASLQQGGLVFLCVFSALVEAVQLKVVTVTKTTVKVEWVWQRKAESVTEKRYRVRLRRDSERQTLSLWPDQRQLTFINLKPNTEYSLLLLADNETRSIIPVRTNFDEVLAVTTVTPLLLLAVTIFIVSILCRTVCRSYFFPPISSPRGSSTGRWLMDPNHHKTAERNILHIEDFQVMDVLGENGLITIGPNPQYSSEEDLHENDLLSISQLSTKRSALEVDIEYIPDAPVTTKHPLIPLQSYEADYGLNCQKCERVFRSEESREADAALPSQKNDVGICFPEVEHKPDDFSARSHQTEATLKCHFLELMANRCVDQITWESEYVVKSSFLGKTDV